MSAFGSVFPSSLVAHIPASCSSSRTRISQSIPPSQLQQYIPGKQLEVAKGIRKRMYFRPVPCTIAETTPGETWFYACLLLNLITLICYGVVWYALKAKIREVITCISWYYSCFQKALVEETGHSKP